MQTKLDHAGEQDVRRSCVFSCESQSKAGEHEPHEIPLRVV